MYNLYVQSSSYTTSFMYKYTIFYVQSSCTVFFIYRSLHVQSSFILLMYTPDVHSLYTFPIVQSSFISQSSSCTVLFIYNCRVQSIFLYSPSYTCTISSLHVLILYSSHHIPSFSCKACFIMCYTFYLQYSTFHIL